MSTPTPTRPRVRSALRRSFLAALLPAALVTFPAAAPAQTAPTGRSGLTSRISVGPGGGDAHGENADPYNHAISISADGRFVAFSSRASDLVPGDDNSQRDVFVHDRESGLTERVSVRSDGAEATGISSSTGMGSTHPSISGDGRFVAFMSEATNLVPGDLNGAPDVFVHDRATGTTEAVSVDLAGHTGDNWSRSPSISADGRFVAFDSNAMTLVQNDANAQYDVFVRDRQAGTTAAVSHLGDGTQGNGVSYGAAISGDGSAVAFYSMASNLVPGDTNGYNDVFVADRVSRTVERVSVASDGAEANDQSYTASISGDGRLVAFITKASNLVPTDLNGTLDAFVHDRVADRTRRLTVTSAGTSHDDAFPRPGYPYEDLSLPAVRPRVSLSPDGRFAAFVSRAANLSAGDTNGLVDVFVRDLVTGSTERISVTPDGGAADGSALWAPAVSAEGRVVAFVSEATNLVPGDGNAERDVFVRDRGAPLDVVGLRATRDGDTVVVSGSVTTSGIPSATADEVGDVDIVDAGPAGMDLEGAAMVWRPETSDLLLRWEVTQMPSARGVATGGNAFEVRSGVVPSAGGMPGVAYEAVFHAGGHEFYAEVVGGPAVEARLLNCDAYPCADLGAIQGSLGSTGLEVHAVVPISALGISPGATISGIDMSTGVGDARGLVFVPEFADLEDLTLARPSVEVAVAPAGTPASEVSFEPASLAGAAFFASRNAPAGDAEAWARVCLGTACSLSRADVTG